MNNNLFGESMQSKELKSEQLAAAQNKRAQAWEIDSEVLRQNQATMPRNQELGRKEKLLIEMELKS